LNVPAFTNRKAENERPNVLKFLKGQGKLFSKKFSLLSLCSGQICYPTFSLPSVGAKKKFTKRNANGEFRRVRAARSLRGFSAQTFEKV